MSAIKFVVTFLAVLMISAVFLAPLQCGAEPAVSWRDGLKISVPVATKVRKSIFVFLYDSSCGVCKRLESQLFVEAEVAKYLEDRFVCVRLEFHHEEGAALVKQYGIRGVPCLMVFGPDGKLRAFKSCAPNTAEEFVERVNQLDEGKSI